MMSSIFLASASRARPFLLRHIWLGYIVLFTPDAVPEALRLKSGGRS